jgi:parallel beta-helix repeat protein
MVHKNLPLLSMLFLFGLFTSSRAVAGVIFYVDNSGSPVCSDSPANGSTSNPLCTINYGISRISGGDTLYIKAGTYREDVYINGPAGTAVAPTIIRAYPGETVTIVGAGVNSGRVKIVNTSYITFDGFIITNFNQGLFVDNSQYVTVHNSTVHHVGQEGIGVHLDSSYITIQNNTVHDTRQWQYNGEGIYVGHGSTASKDNSHHVTVRNNKIYNTTDEGIEIKPGTHDCVIEGNNVSRALQDPGYSGTGAGSIEIGPSINGNQVWTSDPRHIVRNNLVHDTKMAIRADTGVAVYNNVVYNIDPAFPGIYMANPLGDSYTRKIFHNTVDLPSDRAIIIKSGTADVMNNIGPAITNNVVTSDAYYVGKSVANYHLASGSAPINGGRDLTSIVPTDIEGKSRVTNPPPDLGAYEYVSGGLPVSPTGLRVM